MEILMYSSAMKQNNKTIGDYTCDFCILNFHSKAERNEHIMVHFEKKSCSDCNRILIRIADDWYEIHADVNCTKVKCESELNINAEESCEEIPIKSEYEDCSLETIETSNSNEDTADCEFSEFGVNNDDLTILHINMNSTTFKEDIFPEKQQVNEPVICKQPQEPEKLKIDDAMFPPKRNYTKPPTVQCTICDVFMSKIKIKTHLQKAHVPRIIVPKELETCGICGRSFAKYGLKAHLNTHSEAKRFVCSYCGSGFRLLHHLRMHSNSHTGEKPFTCNVCNKKFARDTVLRAHMLVHTGEKPCKCPIEGCDRAYAYSIDLKRHKYSVHGIYTKKHICPICSKVYSENKLLKKHLESHST